GLGVVAYTILLSIRQRSANRAALVGAAAGAAAPAVPAEVDPVPEASAPATPSAAPIVAPRAGFWIRMGALFIDIVLISVIVAVLNTPDSFWIVALARYRALMW